MIKEVAVENYTNIPAAIAAGANRIELNDNLAAGGTTVSRGVMASSAEYAKEHGVPLVAMIRPRGGNFVYTPEEIAIMVGDLRSAREVGVTAVTFGATTPNGDLDTATMSLLLDASAGMDVVCHMAFDAINPAAQNAAIDWLADHGVVRILTHGGPLTEPIAAMAAHLQELIAYAGNRITILPGGGIRATTVDALVAELGVTEVHGTRIINY